MHNLRLFSPEEEHDFKTGPPAPFWSLGDYFIRWHEPQILVVEERSAATTRQYVEALAWWRACLASPAAPDGPSIETIDEPLMLGFLATLAEATYRRGVSGKPRRLAEWTRQKHAHHLLVLVKHAGLESGCPSAVRTARNIQRRIRRHPPSLLPPELFEIDELRRLAIAADRLEPPRRRRGRATPWQSTREFRSWCRAFLAILFYTGERRGDVLSIGAHDLIRRRDGVYVRIRPQKTGKDWIRRLHPIADAMLELAPRMLNETRLLCWPLDFSTLRSVWYRWQTIAEIEREKQLPIKTIRACHMRELARLGGRDAIELARAAGQHSSASVTRSSYVDPVNDLVPLLPNLW
jgi:integrase